jgi:hypothetical protein
VAPQGQVFKSEEDVSQNFRHHFKTSNPPLGNFNVPIFAFTTSGTDAPHYLRAPTSGLFQLETSGETHLMVESQVKASFLALRKFVNFRLIWGE